LAIAVEQGYAAVQFNDGICLEERDGILRDRQEALYYFKFTATQELALAQ
jgi:TPR repeat protein